MVQRIIRDREAWVVDEATGDIIGFDHGTRTQNIVSASTNSTGRIETISAGAGSFRIDTLQAPAYAGYYQKRPFQSLVVPFGTATINETILTGGTSSRSVDTATTFNGRPTTKLTVTGGASSPNVECGTAGATITLDAEGQALLTRTPFVAVKIGAGNTLSSGVLYVGDATYANFYTFNLAPVGTVGEWTILAKLTIGASSTTGTPNLAAAVRAKLRLTMTANVAVGDIWLAPFYVTPQTKQSVVFTVDDGYDEWEWLAAEAYKRRVPISFGIASDLVGTVGYLSTTQIRSILNDYDGLHNITNHARVNSSYGTLGLDTYVSHVEYCRDYLMALGVPAKQASLHQYVQGSFDQTLIDALKVRGYLSAREVGASNRGSGASIIAAGGVTADHMFKIPATVNLENTQNLTTVQSYLNSSSLAGTSFIMGHRFEAAAGTVTYINGYDDSYGVLNLLDWLAEKRDTDGWKLRSWSEWYDDQASPQFPALIS